MRLKRQGVLLGILGLALSARGDSPVKFDEVFGLVKSNLVGVSETDLNSAATRGFIEKLQGKVDLIEPGAPVNAGELLGKTNVFEGAFSYVRVNRVAKGLGERIADSVKSGGKLKGVVLDLRFAKGDDYAAAVEVVNSFLGTEQDVLKWGEEVGKTSARSEVIDLPVVVLINRQTMGAAEALAGAMKAQQLALLIGNRTAGQALVFAEFPLSNGQKLKVARTKVELANGSAIGTEGLTPDILVEVDERNERRWLEDPYLPIVKPGTPSGPAPFLSSVTNRVGRRINGAEVGRRHRQELEEEDGELVERPKPVEPAVPVVQDAALARGLDFLKGLTAARLRNAK